MSKYINTYYEFWSFSLNVNDFLLYLLYEISAVNYELGINQK